MLAAGCAQVSKVCDLGEVPLPTRTRGGVLGAAHYHFFRSCDWPLATPGHPAPIEMPKVQGAGGRDRGLPCRGIDPFEDAQRVWAGTYF